MLSELASRLDEKYEEFRKIQELKRKFGRLPKDGNSVEVIAKGFEDPEDFERPIVEVEAPSDRQRATQWILASGSAIKILVKEEGWYRVTQPELLAAGLRPDAKPKFLQLFTDGREQALRVKSSKDGRLDPEDFIEFYGTGLDTLSTDTRVYWLVVGSKLGKRISTVTGDGNDRALPHFAFTQETEYRTWHVGAVVNGDEDNFLGSLIGVIPEGETEATPVDETITVSNLALPPQKKAILKVAIQGFTYRSHRVKILFNGRELGEVAFVDQNLGSASFKIPHAWLVEGDNLVTFQSLAGEENLSFVDSIQLTYQHKRKAEEDTLKCTAMAGKQVRIG
jgi:hypothetical protein